MTTAILVASAMVMVNTNPITMAVFILAISLMVSFTIFKTTMTSWMAFVTVIIFSSGMMTLFNYTASLSSNEVNKTLKMPYLFSLVLIVLVAPSLNSDKSNVSMKTFSGNTMLIVLTLVLLLTLVAISSHGHHPHQTLSSSF